MVEYAVRELITKNLTKMQEFLDSLLKAIGDRSKCDRYIDDVEIIKLLHTLKIVTASVTEEVEFSGPGKHHLNARNCMLDATLPKIFAEFDILPSQVKGDLAGDDGSARQKIISEMCLHQSEHFRRRAVQLERELKGTLAELEGMRRQIAKLDRFAPLPKGRLVAL
jgi:hypothetical protein